MKALIGLALIATVSCGLPKPEEFKKIQGSIQKGFDSIKDVWTKGLDGTVSVTSHYSNIVTVSIADCFDGGCDPVPVFKGKDGASGADGAVGETGEAGADGAAGVDAEACVITDTSYGAVIKCGDNEVVLNDGVDGEQGERGKRGKRGKAGADGADGTEVQIIDLCDNGDEILIKLGDDKLIAFFTKVSAKDNGNKNDDEDYLAVLSPGTYITTDGNGCVFTVEADYSVTY